MHQTTVEPAEASTPITRELESPTESSLVNTIVGVVAEFKDVPPTAVDFQLHEYIDSTVLEALVTQQTAKPAACQLTFEHDDILVRIQSTGTMFVSARKSTPSTPSIDEPATPSVPGQ